MSTYCFITSNLAGNLVLSVFARCKDPNTKVVMYGIHAKSYWNGFGHQLWKKEPICGDSFYLVPKHAPGLKLAIVVCADMHDVHACIYNPCML